MSETTRRFPESTTLPLPSVKIFPYLSEQGSRGQTSNRPEPKIHEVPASFERLFADVNISPVEKIQGNELKFQGSCLLSFLERAWKHLRLFNVLVTHRNFLANEVLARGSPQEAGNIPNAAVVCLKVRRGQEETKTLFFVRHCTSHHNAARRGSGSMTTCADVSSLRDIAAALRQHCGSEKVLYGSSILPRAILSCIALQRDVSQGDLERVRLSFQPDAKARSEEIASYQQAHACLRGTGRGSYCNGAQGTFILGSNRSRP